MRNKRDSGEFSAASMADIAFLLLIFFLMVTTIDTDKGIARKLPPWPDPRVAPTPAVIKARNVFDVRVNSRDQLLVENEYLGIKDLKEATKEFLLNYGKKSNLSENPEKAVVSLKNDRGTSYFAYIQVQNELTAAYNEIRDNASMQKFGISYDKLTKPQKKQIKTKYPMKISEAEPEGQK